MRCSDFGIVNNTGDYISNEIKLLDIDSNKIRLTELIDKTTIISLISYDCEDFCPKVTNGLIELIKNLSLIPGRDYQIITIGLRHDMNFKQISEYSKSALNAIQNKHIGDGWFFFTSDEKNYRLLSQNLGYTYFQENKKNMHIPFLVVISPQKRIVNYMYGTRFLPPDFEITYDHALKNKVRETVSRDLKYCSNYVAPAHEQFHKIVYVFGTFIFLSALTLFLFLVFYKKKSHR